MDAKADITKVETAVKTAAADATAVKSWIALNWHYALAFAIGGLFLGAAIGMKIGQHFHG